jgi:F-type H+-transporting ATPase subunit b
MVRSRPTAVLLLLAVFLVLATPAVLLAAEEHGGANPKPDIFVPPRIDLTLWTIVVFAVLLWVLKKMAWKPMLQGLQARESRIRGALDEAQTARDEAHKLRDQFQVEMGKIHNKMREMLDEARRDGQHTKDRLLAEGKAEIGAERDRALREIDRERQQAVQELWNQTAQLATLVSAKAIGRNLNEADHRSLVDEAVAELKNSRAGTPSA